MIERSDFYRGDIADKYDAERAGSSIWRTEDEVVVRLLGEARREPRSIVLDMPVGTGRFIRAIEEFGLTPLGVDLSIEMLKQAGSKSASGSLLVVGNGKALPLRSSVAASVICIRFAHLVNRVLLTKTLRELRRVLAEDGSLILGIRLHALARDREPRGRWSRFARRLLRSARFRLGRASSHSHSERWFMQTIDVVGLQVKERWEVTRYDDGSHYWIFALNPLAGDGRVHRSFELIGLPGVGKTTTARAIVRSGRSDVIDGFRAVRQLSVWQCFRSHPVATTRLIARVAPVARALKQDAAKKVLVAALRQRQVDLEARDTVIHEEGVAHEAWRQLMAGNDLSDGFLERVLPVSDATVLLEAPTDALLARLAHKASPGPVSRSLLSATPDDEIWVRAISHYERIKGILGRSGRAVYMISNQSLDQSIAVDELREIVAGHQRTVLSDHGTLQVES